MKNSIFGKSDEVQTSFMVYIIKRSSRFLLLSECYFVFLIYTVSCVSYGYLCKFNIEYTTGHVVC